MKTTWMSIQALESRFGVRSAGSSSAVVDFRGTIAGESELSDPFRALLALAICIAARRADRIHDHLQDALRAGASAQQILEVIEIALLMSGDRSLRCGLEAFSTLEDHETP